MEREEEEESSKSSSSTKTKLSKIFWHGGSAYDAWFSCASNQGNNACKMWKPEKFKLIYLMATLYVLTLTLPSVSAVYWPFGDMLLNRCNAFALLPRTGFRDTAVVLMIIHQFITFGFACTPLFLAIIFPFFGPINSTVGSLLVSFTVYIVPALAHMITFASASTRENAVDGPPKFIGVSAGLYSVNIFVVVWVSIVGFGFGEWASMLNFIHQIDTFGLFTKCYQCPKHQA